MPTGSTRRIRKVKRAREDAQAAGKARLRVRPRARARKRLNRAGRARLRAAVTYTSAGGEPNTKSKRIRLRKRG